MDSRRARRGFKRFLEAVGFILAEFELKGSHGVPIRGNFYGFATCELAQQCLRERYLCPRETNLCLRCYIYVYGIFIWIYIYMEYRIYVWNVNLYRERESIYIYIYIYVRRPLGHEPFRSITSFVNPSLLKSL